MARVFISFVHEDQKVATAVQHYLSSRLKLPKDVFLSSDQFMIFAGEDWLMRIGKELREAQVVVLMLSKRSVDRPWVNFEAGAAWLANKAIVPVCYGNLTKDRLPKPYSGIQALDLRQEQTYLLHSVAHHLGIGTVAFFSQFDRTLEAGASALARARGEAPPANPLAAADMLLDRIHSINAALDQFQDEQ